MMHGMGLLDLTPDELLSTTRTVRRRLDLARPVEREVLEQCLRLAQQAPSGSNRQGWHFVVVTDPGRRAALADIWRRGAATYMAMPSAVGAASTGDPERDAQMSRIRASVEHLVEHLHEVPVHVVPCIEGRTDGRPMPVVAQASTWGSIAPAIWSFMLALRARGLGAAWTSFHLFHEEEAAEVLGIPYDKVMQAALLPVAYTIGTDFKPAPRAPLETMVHWDAW
jgi:nitroreductase